MDPVDVIPGFERKAIVQLCCDESRLRAADDADSGSLADESSLKEFISVARRVSSRTEQLHSELGTS